MIIRNEKILVFNAQAVDGLGLVLFLKVAASFLSKEEFGGYLLAASLVSFVSTYFSVIDQGVIRNIAKSKAVGEIESKLITVLFGHFAISSAIGMLIYFLYTSVSIALPFDNLTAFLILIWLTLDSTKNVSLASTNVLRDRKHFLVAKVIEHSSKILLLLMFAMSQGLSITILFAAIVASSVICTAYLLKARFKARVSLRQIKLKKVYSEAFQFSWPLMIWASFSWLHVMGSRWIVGFYMGSDAVANFGIITTLSTMPISIILGLVSAYTLPILYQKELNAIGEVVQYILKVVGAIVLLFLLLYIPLYLFNKNVVSIFGDASYTEFSYLLPHMYMAMSFNAVGVILGYKSYVSYQTSKLILANVAPGIINMVLAIMLVPKYGLDGAGLAFIVSNLVFCLLNIRVFLTPFEPVVYRE